MSIFRDVRDLTESKIRASNVECLSERAQLAMTYRLMHELENRWNSSSSMTVAQAKLEKCGEWLQWWELARQFDKKLGNLKFADEEVVLLVNCFAEGQLDAVLTPECTTPSKSWAAVQKIMWLRREKSCNSLRQQSNADIEATKQKLLQMEKDQCSSEGGVGISWYLGVQCKRALHYTSLFKERQTKQTYPAWTRCLRPRGVGDADAQGAMRQLRGVGPRCRPKGRAAYARGV